MDLCFHFYFYFSSILRTLVPSPQGGQTDRTNSPIVSFILCVDAAVSLSIKNLNASAIRQKQIDIVFLGFGVGFRLGFEGLNPPGRQCHHVVRCCFHCGRHVFFNERKSKLNPTRFYFFSSLLCFSK